MHLRSRLFINLVLFVIVFGLALFLFTTEKEEDTTPDVKLTDLNPAAVDTIRIVREQSGEIVFRKENGKWLMQSPYRLPANEFRINTMLKLPGAHSYTWFSKDEVELSRFALDSPQVSIEFDDTRIDFGDTSPLAEQRYVLTNDTVHLINDSLYQQLQAPATFFLDTRLLPEEAEIEAITLPVHTVRQQDGTWHIEPEADISADDIMRLVEAWKNLNAISVRNYENIKADGTITVELKGQAPLQFVIAAPLPQLILARPDLGIQYHISGYDAERLFPQPITDH